MQAELIISCQYLSPILELKSKILYRIVIADAFNDFFQCLIVSRIFAVFHPCADQVAEDSAEIVVSCVGKKASGVGRHSAKPC